MISLITYDEALAQLRLDEGAFDEDDIKQKMEEASDIVVGYIKHLDNSWSEDTCPPRIKAAIKIVLSNLYDNRTDDPLTPGVKNILKRDRDPALA
jgi:hypothetical protein